MSDQDMAVRLQAALDRQLLDIMENGMPVYDKDGRPILGDDQKPIRTAPTAAYLQAARQRLKELQLSQGEAKSPMEMLLEQMKSDGHLPAVDTEGDDPA